MTFVLAYLSDLGGSASTIGTEGRESVRNHQVPRRADEFSPAERSITLWSIPDKRSPPDEPNPGTVKRLQQAAAITVDPETLERARHSLAVPLRQLRVISSVAARELHSGRSEPVAVFASALGDTEDSEGKFVTDWVVNIGTVRQRMLLLLGLAALSAVPDAVDAEAGVQLPAHMVLVIYALVALATLLNEAIARPTE